jgi:hypothetical protein
MPTDRGYSARLVGSYWQLDAGWGDRWTNAALPHAVDFAVIGGGFAGLMTATSPSR